MFKNNIQIIIKIQWYTFDERFIEFILVLFYIIFWLIKLANIPDYILLISILNIYIWIVCILLFIPGINI